jgi:hypothetical protein
MSCANINCVSALVVVLLLGGTASSAPAGGREQQSEMVLTWGRYGGFAGFCDEMQVSVSGEVRVGSCRNKSDKVGKLSSEDSRRLDEWRRSFGSVVIESNDGAVADGLSVKLTLKGTGKDQPTEMQRDQILAWAQRVYGEIG